MLQWMGGSRRKVATSRKSTQKRQKQYFEQRRRQQQQFEAASIENHIDGSVMCDRQKGNRSLDIISLLNVPKVAEESRPQCANESMPTIPVDATYMRPFEALDSSHHNFTTLPTTEHDIVTPIDCAKPIETVTPWTLSSPQVAKKSSESDACGASYTWRNTSKISSTEPKYWKNNTSVQLSILDLVGEDGASDNAGENPLHEAHAALSIEGIGKAGAETPEQSPCQPGRTQSGVKSSFTKAAKKLRSFNTFHTMLDDLEMKVRPSMQECVVQDTERSSPGSHLDSFSMSGDMFYPFSHVDHKLSTIKDIMQRDGKQWDISFLDEDRHDNFWNANSAPLDDNVVYGKRGPNMKNEYAANRFYSWENSSSDLGFEGCDLRFRCQEKVTDRFNASDGGIRHFLSSDEPKYSPQADCLSPYAELEHKKYSFAWSGEDPCSSSAVRGEDIADMPSPRCRRRFDKDLQRPLKSSMNEYYDEGMGNRVESRMKRGEECDRSRKYIRSNLTCSKSAYFSKATFNEELVADEDRWLLEEGFPLPNTGSCYRSSGRSQPWGEDLFGTDAQADVLRNSGWSFGRSEKEKIDEYSSDNVPFAQSFRSRKSVNTPSNSSCGESWLGGHNDFKIHVQSNSFEVADFFSATANPEGSVQGSVTEAGDEPKSQTPDPEKVVQTTTRNRNITTENRLPGGDINTKASGASLCVHENVRPQETSACSSEHVKQTSLPGKTLPKSDVKLVCEEWEGSASALHQWKLNGINKSKDVNDEILNGMEVETMPMESSCQLMMFRQCVQMLCILQS